MANYPVLPDSLQCLYYVLPYYAVPVSKTTFGSTCLLIGDIIRRGHSMWNVWDTFSLIRSTNSPGFVYSTHTQTQTVPKIQRFDNDDKVFLCSTAWGIPENDVTQMGFPVYRSVFCKICKDKRNLNL